MQDDPIVEEVRRVRAAHEKQFKHDIREILADAKRLEDDCRSLVVSFVGQLKPPLPTRLRRSDPVWKDPIVEEVHQLREEHAAKFNYDAAAILADARMRQGESGHRVVSYAKKKRKPT